MSTQMVVLEQGSEDWLLWRNRGLGSSDIGILLGFDQWKDEEELFKEKTNQVKSSFKGNPATERGQRLEPCVRAEWELTVDKDFPPATFIHRAYPFMKASLDGWHEPSKTIIEIKCPNKKSHAEAIAGRVPDYYYPQVQHLLLVAEGLHLDYLSFDGVKIVPVPVKPDLTYQKQILEKATAFWARVEEYLKEQK